MKHIARFALTAAFCSHAFAVETTSTVESATAWATAALAQLLPPK